MTTFAALAALAAFPALAALPTTRERRFYVGHA
jgi:hypothetical protein